jgi:hypothetical protein
MKSGILITKMSLETVTLFEIMPLFELEETVIRFKNILF